MSTLPGETRTSVSASAGSAPHHLHAMTTDRWLPAPPAYQLTCSQSWVHFQPNVPQPLLLALDPLSSSPTSAWSSHTGALRPAFEVFHEKPAHLFMIRDDLTAFEHIHPDVLANGRLLASPSFQRPGRYVGFLQVQPAGNPQPLLLTFPLQVGSPTSAALPRFQEPISPLLQSVGEFSFSLRSVPTPGQPGMLTVGLSQRGYPLRHLTPFLGAPAHGVLVRYPSPGEPFGQPGDFLHVHPAEQPTQTAQETLLQFHTQLPRPGRYKFWLQAQPGGQLLTVPWVFQAV
ncbi:MAG: hypothetical protein SFZ03_05685 [Candidatus Melainabacteria bacterium]|nr:hypothetical protein [Candidatus Melainabacteria bacterium]